MNSTDAKIAIRDVVDSLLEGRGEALLSTASAKGEPHATWMATIALPGDQGEMVTLTSPSSRKVANIRENPEIEWLFTDDAKRCLVYLKGVAEVVEDPAAIKAGWAALPDKERAYFLNFINSGIGFSVISSRIRKATLTIPRAGKSHAFSWEEILATPSRVPAAEDKSRTDPDKGSAAG